MLTTRHLQGAVLAAALAAEREEFGAAMLKWRDALKMLDLGEQRWSNVALTERGGVFDYIFARGVKVGLMGEMISDCSLHSQSLFLSLQALLGVFDADFQRMLHGPSWHELTVHRSSLQRPS